MKRNLLLPLFLVSTLLANGCNRANTISYKTYIETVKSELLNAEQKDIFIFTSTTCVHCQRIKPLLKKYISENEDQNLHIYELSVDYKITNTTICPYKDSTLGTFCGDRLKDGLKNLDDRLYSFAFQTGIPVTDDDTYPVIANIAQTSNYPYTFMYTPLIIWYQNGLEKKLVNNVDALLTYEDGETTPTYESFVSMMQYPTDEIIWNTEFNLTSY